MERLLAGQQASGRMAAGEEVEFVVRAMQETFFEDGFLN